MQKNKSLAVIQIVVIKILKDDTLFTDVASPLERSKINL